MFSRNQESVLYFRDAADAMHFSLFNDREEIFQEGLEYFSLAVESFGLSELKFRDSGRKSHIEKDSCAKEIAASARLTNQQGIRYLKKSKGCFEKILKNLDTVKNKNSKSDKAKVLKFSSDLSSFYAELEIKPVDVAKLKKKTEEVVNLALKGEREIYKSIISHMDELLKARSSKDRGVRENIPWWKMVAIAIYIGLSALNVWRCIVRNKCRKFEKAVYRVGKTIASLIRRFC